MRALLAVAVVAVATALAPSSASRPRARSDPRVGSSRLTKLYSTGADIPTDGEFTQTVVRPYLINLKMTKAGLSQSDAEADTDAFLASPSSAAYVAKFKAIIEDQAKEIADSGASER